MRKTSNSVKMCTFLWCCCFLRNFQCWFKIGRCFIIIHANYENVKNTILLKYTIFILTNKIISWIRGYMQFRKTYVALSTKNQLSYNIWWNPQHCNRTIVFSSLHNPYTLQHQYNELIWMKTYCFCLHH